MTSITGFLQSASPVQSSVGLELGTHGDAAVRLHGAAVG